MSGLPNVARIFTPVAESMLAGSAPPHRFYVFLHTPNRPTDYPARVTSKVQRALQLNVLKLGGLVNFSWSAEQPVLVDVGGVGGVQEMDEAYAATAFSPSGRLDIPSLSSSNMAEVVATLTSHANLPSRTQTFDDVHLYVCTHGARDCRCGDRGGLVVKALRDEVERRNFKHVKVGEVGHVGGHK
jgi:hypothetical protein